MAAAVGNGRPRLFVLFCVAMLVIFAITILIFYSETRRIADNYPDLDDGLYIFGLPSVPYWATMIYGADKLILGAAIVSLFAAAAGWLLAFVKVPVETEFVSAVLGVASLGTSLGALVDSMYMHSKYGTSKNPEYSVEYQDESQWTVEGWTCMVKRLLDYDQANDYTTMCKDSTIIRFLTIPLVIFSLLLVVAMYLLFVDRKKQAAASTENVELGAVDPPPSYNENAPPKYTKNAEPEPEPS